MRSEDRGLQCWGGEPKLRHGSIHRSAALRRFRKSASPTIRVHPEQEAAGALKKHRTASGTNGVRRPLKNAVEVEVQVPPVHIRSNPGVVSRVWGFSFGASGLDNGV